MTISASGVVSAADIRTEYGLSGTVSFADLYRGGSYIRAKAANNNATNLASSVPTSGEITLDNFRGTAKGFRYTFTTGATDQNASTLFGSDYGVNYPKEIVINSGVELGATTTSNRALICPAGVSGSLSITNNGTLTGAGGAAGAAGGDAFEAAVACVFVNNGTIRAGGGGGGTGGQGFTQSTTNQNAYQLYYCYIVTVWAGRHRYWWGNSGGCGNPHSGWACQNCCTSTSCGSNPLYTYSTGHPDEPFSGCHSGCSGSQKNYKRVHKATTTTNYYNGGAGGVGAGYNQSAGTGAAGGTNAGAGGNGGAFGSSGNAGANGNNTNGTAGGGAGAYIRGISFVTLTQSGTVLGGTA